MAMQKLPESTVVRQASATIIPFPVRPSAQEAPPGEPSPQDRLARAVESLNKAMADQRQAVAAWREVLAELKASTTKLDESLRGYRSNLRTLGNSVSALHSKARSMEAWADGVLETPNA